MFDRLLQLLDRWVWPYMVAATVVLFWLTSSISLSVVLPSLKAAVPALQSAAWLYRHESERPGNGVRAGALVILYVAAGLWRAAAAAFLGVVVLILLANQFGLQPNRVRAEVLLKTLFCCIGATCIVGLVGIAMAWKANVKLWVHPRIFFNCGGDFRNIFHLSGHAKQMNHVIFILATSIGLPGVGSAAWLLASMTATGGPLDEATKALSKNIMLVGFVGYPIFAIVLIGYLVSKIVATRPEDCWPDTSP